MADTTNGQITDAVTQSNVKVLAESPALSLSNLYQTNSQSLSLAVQNSVMAQQQSNIIHQTTTTQGVSLLYSFNGASTGVATTEMFKSNNEAQASTLNGLAQIIQAAKA